MDNYLVYTKDVVVSVHDTGVMGELKPSAVLQFFQDAATEHAALLKLSRFELRPLGLYWVVTRISAKITREILIGEHLKVLTYPHPPKAASTDRDFFVTDEKQNIVITGSSKWCVLDLVTHTPKRITPLFPFPAEDYRTDFAIGGEAVSLPAFDKANSQTKSFEVRNCELDTNFHMNNARYGDMLYNVVDPAIFGNKYISELDANFMHELKAGQQYDIRYRIDEKSLDLSTVSGDKECFRGSVTLSPKAA